MIARKQQQSVSQTPHNNQTINSEFSGQYCYYYYCGSTTTTTITTTAFPTLNFDFSDAKRPHPLLLQHRSTTVRQLSDDPPSSFELLHLSLSLTGARYRRASGHSSWCGIIYTELYNNNNYKHV